MINIEEIERWITLIVFFITSIGVICTFIKSCFKKIMNPISEKLDKLDRENCMNYLTEFLADIRNGIRKNEYQIARAHDVYKHYKDDLKGNSYIHEQWQMYMKEKR